MVAAIIKALLLASPMALQFATAGEIADYYLKLPDADRASLKPPIAPPRRLETNHGITEIGIERQGCFGSCPEYVFIARSDGTARFHGTAHVDKLGDWEADLDLYRFHEVANFIAQMRYAALHKTWTATVTDGDTAYAMFVINGDRKVFENYFRQGPTMLWALEQLIDSLATGVVWRRGVLTPKPGVRAEVPSAHTLQPSSTRPRSLTINFGQDAALTEEQIDTVVQLAKECGLAEPVEVQVGRTRPLSRRFVEVQGRAASSGARKTSDVVFIYYTKWEGWRSPTAKQIGEFWVNPPYKTKRVISKVQVLGKEATIQVLSDAITEEMLTRIVSAFAEKKFRFQPGSRDSLEGVPLLEPRSISCEGKAKYEMVFGGNVDYSVRFELVRDEIVITSPSPIIY